jgi:hypothetical protein
MDADAALHGRASPQSKPVSVNSHASAGSGAQNGDSDGVPPVGVHAATDVAAEHGSVSNPLGQPSSSQSPRK